uniref:Uncharacterized protein LOC105632604 n=1 Tax=Rhizophora mucronata TaxID=61149 RepID=A0A2P2LE26_RHIMU
MCSISPEKEKNS